MQPRAGTHTRSRTQALYCPIPLLTDPAFECLCGQHRRILEKGKVVHFSEGDCIIRESSMGSSFYLLLEGLCCALSIKKRIDTLVKAGESFGETALASLLKLEVRRECHVIAMRDTWCLRIKARDLVGPDFESLELKALQKAYIAKLLATVKFFDQVPHSLLVDLGRQMDIERYSSNRVVFEEGDVADKLYIVLSGSVGIFKRKKDAPPATRTPMRGIVRHGTAEADFTAVNELFLACFSPNSKYPWFGESAIVALISNAMSVPTRAATAYTFEPTQLLTLHASLGRRLMDALPEFGKVIHVGHKAYTVTNQLNGTQAGRLAK